MTTTPQTTARRVCPECEGFGVVRLAPGSRVELEVPVVRRRLLHGSAVRAIREARGLRSGEVADAIKVSRGFYSHLEAGERQPSPATAVALANELHVALEQITFESA